MSERKGQWSAKDWRDAIRVAVNEPGAGGIKKLRILADTLVNEALDGDVVALKEIGDRLDGKVPQAVTGADEGPIKLIVEWAKQE